MPENLRSATRRARSAYRCGMCNGIIRRGDHHHVSTNVYDGRVYDFRTCAHCKRDRVLTYVFDTWQPDEGVTLDDAMEWAPDAAEFCKSGHERGAARRWLARFCGGEGE